jgi:hypothetical protein
MTFVVHTLMIVLPLAADGGALERAPRPARSPLLAPTVRGVRVDPTDPRPPTFDEPKLGEAKDGSGDLLYDASGFSARIAPDGFVTFHDKHLSLLSLLPFLPIAGPRNIPSLQSTFVGLLRNHKVPRADESRMNDGSRMLIPLLTPYRPDPREACRVCNEPFDSLPLNLMGGFDLTDEVMRMSSQDPYRYEKARFLIATRELRVRKAARRHAEDIRRAAGELSGRLRTIACDTHRSLRERRQIIEKLRDELDGATPEAQAAADTITRFLESHFGPTATGGNVCPAMESAP